MRLHLGISLALAVAAVSSCSNNAQWRDGANGASAWGTESTSSGGSGPTVALAERPSRQTLKRVADSRSASRRTP